MDQPPADPDAQERFRARWDELYSGAYSKQPTWGIRQLGIAESLVRQHGADECIARAERLFQAPPDWLKPPYAIANLDACWDYLVSPAKATADPLRAEHERNLARQRDPDPADDWDMEDAMPDPEKVTLVR